MLLKNPSGFGGQGELSPGWKHDFADAMRMGIMPCRCRSAAFAPGAILIARTDASDTVRQELLDGDLFLERCWLVLGGCATRYELSSEVRAVSDFRRARNAFAAWPQQGCGRPDWRRSDRVHGSTLAIAIIASESIYDPEKNNDAHPQHVHYGSQGRTTARTSTRCEDDA